MPFSIHLLLVTLLTLLLTLAAAEPGEELISIGPGPYEEVFSQVEELHSKNLRKRIKGLVNDNPQFQKTRINKHNKFERCAGVYLCDKEDFRGNCYWKCYPELHEIYPDRWWLHRIVSVGPEPGVKVYVSGGECVIVGPYDKVGYPGKNLKKGLRNHVGCFYVSLHSA